MSRQPIISIRGLTKRFGGFTALESIDIDIEPGEFFALLGPSGCGKSTLLRIIAGFESPTEGEVRIDGVDMAGVQPNRRPVNMVFQSYAVFPHMSVAENVSYGLQLDRIPKQEVRDRVGEALGQVHLSEFRDRMPDQLSGGQRQRVALARALVKKPRVLLLDEPLSALDAKLRDAMRLELVKLQQSVGVSFVMVTHDQSEALAVADRIALLDKGRLRQLAAPAELYGSPRDSFVADFIGKINLFDVSGEAVRRGGAAFTVPGLGDVVVPAGNLPDGHAAGAPVRLAVRPEKVRVGLRKPGGGGIKVLGKLGDVAFQGDSSIVEAEVVGCGSVSATVPGASAAPLLDAEPGIDIWLSWDAADMLVLPHAPS